MKYQILILSVALVLRGPLPLWSQTTLTGAEVMSRVDQVMNAPLSQESETTLILTDKKGKEKERVIHLLQKGAEYRLVRFLSPPDQRGIGVLTLPDDVIYLYLPAYKKVRRIAGHIKHSKFAGTDFSYEDMQAKIYSEHFTATLLEDEAAHYLVSLTPLDPKESEYLKLHVRVLKSNFFPETIEYYDKKGKLYKRMTSSRIEKIQGYLTAGEREMIDLKSEHRTRMILNKVRFDIDLDENTFTRRYLEQ